MAGRCGDAAECRVPGATRFGHRSGRLDGYIAERTSPDATDERAIPSIGDLDGRQGCDLERPTVVVRRSHRRCAGILPPPRGRLSAHTREALEDWLGDERVRLPGERVLLHRKRPEGPAG